MIFDSPPALTLSLVASFTSSAVSIRLGLPYAGRLAMATPVARSSHATPVPQSGGLFVMASLTLAILLVAGVSDLRLRELAWLAPALLLTGLGWLDDRADLPALARLAVYALVSVMTVLSGLVPPLAATGSWLLDGAILTFFLLAFINVTNFMDGIDGIVVAGLAPALLFAGLNAGTAGDGGLALRAFVLLGALAGFFVHNRPRASIFLGDCGSIAVGFLTACILIDHAHAQGVVAAVILPLYFLCDTSITLVRRILNREKIWEGHRQHFYQRALDSGQSNGSIIARVAACNVVLCALSYAAAAGPAWQAPALGAALACVAILLLSLARGAR